MKLSEHMRTRMVELEALLHASHTQVVDHDTDAIFNPDNYSVRKAISGDNWKIYQLMSSFFPEDGECQEESKLEFSESDLHDVLFKPEPATQALVAIFKYDGQESLVGYCLYNVIKMDMPFLLIEDIFVHPAFRGAWVSRRMLNYIKSNVVKVLKSTESKFHGRSTPSTDDFESYKILRWSSNDNEEKRVNFYERYGAQLLVEYKRVLSEEDERQDTVAYEWFPSHLNKRKGPPKKSRTLANLRLSAAHRPVVPRSRCRSLVPE